MIAATFAGLVRVTVYQCHEPSPSLVFTWITSPSLIYKLLLLTKTKGIAMEVASLEDRIAS